MKIFVRAKATSICEVKNLVVVCYLLRAGLQWGSSELGMSAIASAGYRPRTDRALGSQSPCPLSKHHTYIHPPYPLPHPS